MDVIILWTLIITFSLVIAIFAFYYLVKYKNRMEEIDIPPDKEDFIHFTLQVRGIRRGEREKFLGFLRKNSCYKADQGIEYVGIGEKFFDQIFSKVKDQNKEKYLLDMKKKIFGVAEKNKDVADEKEENLDS